MHAAGGLGPLGGDGKVVEADETYYGDIPESQASQHKANGRPMSRKKRQRPAQATSALSSHWSSAAVAFAHSTFRQRILIKVVTIVAENIERETRLHTDESRPL